MLVSFSIVNNGFKCYNINGMKKGKLLTIKDDFSLIYAIDVMRNDEDTSIYNCKTSEFDNLVVCFKYLKKYMDNGFSVVVTIGNETRKYPLTSDLKIEDFSKEEKPVEGEINEEILCD